MRQRWHLIALATFTLAATLGMAGWLLDDRMPGADFAGYAAEVEYVHNALLEFGRVPPWNPKWFAGTTDFLSRFKEYVAFPATVVAGPIWGLKVTIWLIRIAAAMGFYLLFTRLFDAPLAAIVAAYAYLFGAVGNHVGERLDGALSYALFPLLALATIEMLRRRSMRAAVALGVLAACQLDDNYLQILTCGPMFLIVLVLRPWRTAAGEESPFADRALAWRWARLTACAACVFLAFGASQIAWLATDLGNHAFFLPGYVRGMAKLLSVYSPFLLVNRASRLDGWIDLHRPLGLYSHVTLADTQYLGMVAMLVALVGWFAVRRQYSMRRWYQTGLALFLAQYWLALGPWTLLFQVLTGFGWSLASVEPIARVAMLGAAAAVGWAALRAGRARSLHAAEAPLVVAIALLLASCSIFSLAQIIPPLARVRSPGKFFDLAPFSLALTMGVSLVGVTEQLARVGFRPRARGAAALLIGALVVVDYWPTTRHFGEGTPRSPIDAARRVAASLPAEDAGLRVLPLANTMPEQPPLSFVLMETPAGGVMNWLPWQATTHWNNFLTVMGTLVTHCTDDGAFPCDSPLPALARVRFAVGERDVRLPGRWRILDDTGRYVWWERGDVLPIGSGYRSYARTSGGDFDTILKVPTALERNALVISGEDVSMESAAMSAMAGEHDGEPLVPVAYRRPAPEHIVLELDAGTKPAIVFVSEAHHPWWRASADGTPAPVLRAQAAFMAVPVGAGRHVIDLRLRPPLVVVAAEWTTAAAWTVLALAMLVVAATSLRHSLLKAA